MLIVRRRTLVYLLVSVIMAVAAWRIVPQVLPPRLSLDVGAPRAAGPAPAIPVASAGESGSLGLAEMEPGSVPVIAIGGSGGSGVPAGPGAAGAEGATTASRGASRTDRMRFGWPMHGEITSYYGPRDDEFHTGIDIAAVTGQAIRAALGGTVVEAGWRGGYGLCVVIDHGNGLQTLYGHNSKLEVEIGDHVESGHLLALAGSTGYSTGPHLHFEILLNGFPVNPMPWLEP